MQHLPPALPRAGGPITRGIGRLALRLLGWRVEGEIPNVPKLVVIVAPHTSNWDFVVGMAVKLALGLRASWLGKHTIFRGPAGALLRRLGGIPVDRGTPHAVVTTCVEEFDRADAMVLALAPEGTRKPGAAWRTGFWYIARGARVPILPLGLDRRSRVIRIGPVVQAEGTMEEQLPRIRDLFRGVSG